MDTEISRWLSSISCGLDLKPLAKDFEQRGFTTVESLKYVESSDLDVFFPSPVKLSYAQKKILLKEIEQLSVNTTKKDNTKTCNDNTANNAVQQPFSKGESSQTSKSFLAAKEESFSEDMQFLQARIASAKTQHSQLLQQARKYDEVAPRRGKTCSNSHLTGHRKRNCKNPACPGVSNCNLRDKHPEVRSEIVELEGLIKDLEKRAEKSKNQLLNFKAAREKASNSFFAIMRPRLRKSNAMKYAGTDRLLLDRDLMTLKKALNNKVPADENNDWQLPLIIEEFNRKNIAPLQGAIYRPDGFNASSSRRLSFSPGHF